MKYKMIFNMPDDTEDFTHATRGVKYYVQITDFQEYLRNQVKYHSDNYSTAELKLLETIRERACEIFTEDDYLV